ncbi:MAG: hypothetical protein K9J06_14795 [Flavobacteriales bacterium]|nr:hypothetical protein [Flavobacteriales bacterium]
MRTAIFLLPALFSLCIGCTDAPTPPAGEEAATVTTDTTAARLDAAKQEVEDSGIELDKLVNDL